jgi:GcrA cell cycle regulator
MRARLRDERRNFVMGSPSQGYAWNDEAISRLRSLWTEGHPTAEIGRRLGMSKNAVVGKSHRLNLPARPSPIRRPNDLDGTRQPAPKRMAVPKLAEMVPVQVNALATPEPPAAPLAVLSPGGVAARPVNSCCWPIGHPGTPAFRFCGNLAPLGKSYCTEHMLVAYVPRFRREMAVPSDAQRD